jgi:FlaG/FlaF family flagellin (archaellin)
MKKLAFVPVVLLLAAIFALVGLDSGVGAQGAESTPEQAASHPAHIHDGACPDVGDVVYPLHNLSATTSAASPAAEGLPLDATPSATPTTGGQVVAEGTTDVDASLDEILSAERAINVHESDVNIQTYIACGDLTGSPTNGKLTVQLQEVNDSGVVGEAQLVDNGDGTTTVTVLLMRSGTPATPAS